MWGPDPSNEDFTRSMVSCTRSLACLRATKFAGADHQSVSYDAPVGAPGSKADILSNSEGIQLAQLEVGRDQVLEELLTMPKSQVRGRACTGAIPDTPAAEVLLVICCALVVHSSDFFHAVRPFNSGLNVLTADLSFFCSADIQVSSFATAMLLFLSAVRPSTF